MYVGYLGSFAEHHKLGNGKTILFLCKACSGNKLDICAETGKQSNFYLWDKKGPHLMPNPQEAILSGMSQTAILSI